MTASHSPHGSAKTWPTEVFPYSSGIVGGVLGGIAMAVIVVVGATLRGDSPWLPANLIAASLLRGLQTASLETLNEFHVGSFVLGAILHMLVSVGIGVTFVALLPTLPGAPWLWSLVLGTLLWVGAHYAILPLLNPVMFQLIDRPSFLVANVLYALVLGATVMRFAKVPNPAGHPLDPTES